MKFKHLILLLLWATSRLLSAQDQIHFDLNMLRANDTIVKQQIEYKHHGKQGTDVLWNFSKLKVVNNKYTVIYEQTNDSLLSGTEHLTRYYYELKNDSLYLIGYENPTTKVTYDLPELILRFPLKLGDTIEGHYRGEGIYCDKLNIKAYGTSKSMADASGMIILPGGDTLKHVTRVHTSKLISEKITPFISDSIKLSSIDSTKMEAVFSPDSIDYYLQTDTAVLKIDTYKWYAAGYRYPIFETVSTEGLPNGAKSDVFSTAFYFSPENHTYLKSDKKNTSLQEELLEKEEQQKKNANNKTESADNNVEGSIINDDIEFTYNYYPNPVEFQLNFEYYLSKDAKVSFAIYNISGLMVYQSPIKSLRAGTHSQTIDMGYCSRGEYVLTVLVNNKPFSEKIIKK